METSSRDKILLIDDEEVNRYLLAKTLGNAGYEILTAASGREALSLAQGGFSLFILDVGLPDMSGHEVCRILKATSATASIPVLEMSARYTQGVNQAEALESGADGYLVQPIDPQVLLATVRALVRLYRSEVERSKMIVELKNAVMVRDEFLSIASHELKTPLTSLLLQTYVRGKNLAKNGPFSAELTKKFIEKDEKQLKRLSKLVDDMLDIAKITSGKLALELETFDLGELARESVERMLPQFEEVGCAFEVHIDGAIEVNWDRFRIEQVLDNLLMNALKYSDGKNVSVTISRKKDHAHLIVTDRGEGIPLESQERIFQRFERAVSKNESSGLGLGLYIVKQIVDSHQGTISLDSRVGIGSTFDVCIPLNFTENK